MAVQEAREVSERKTRLAVYDTDVHHSWQSRDEIIAYLDGANRERFERYGGDVPLVDISSNGGNRPDLFKPGKLPAGGAAPDAEFTRVELMDRFGIEWALLTGGPMGAATFHPDLDYGNALCRAFNEHTVERWLDVDDRYRYAIAVNPLDPVAGAKEAARLAAHPGSVGVMLRGGATLPYGHRHYQPLHEVCAEHDLVWTIHFGSEGKGVNPAPTGTGYPSYYAEMRISRAASYKAHIASFVFEGVFERYPNFKVATIEAGFGWVPAFLWNIDHYWHESRRQLPWVTRPPSELIVERVRFASQPEEEPTPRNGLAKTLEWMHADKTLMFATDFPHWDWDDPTESFKDVPLPLKRRIYSENAKEFFRS